MSQSQSHKGAVGNGRSPTRWHHSVYRGHGRGYHAGEHVRWREVDAAILLDAVDAVTAAGHGILLTRSSDGGAYGITVCAGTDRERFWGHGLDSVSDALGELIDRFGQGWEHE